EVLLAMTPAQALELKRADQDFAKDMAEIGLKADALQVDLERVAAEDRASARQREALLKDWAPKVLAVLVITGYAAATGFILTHVIVPEMESLVMRTLGVLDVALGMVLSYYFGSSAGSKEKTTTMARLASGRRRVS
ncbi:MAG: hypothetical protein ACREYC_18290, partial [Gammaproteobacteria bacterium]